MSQPRPVRAVEPLLKTERVQSYPYNNSCPYYNYGDSVSSERCLVGCVATAIEQLLSYYRYPAALKDSIAGWETENYTLPDVKAGTVIDWDDVADLSLWCGMMVRMNYGVNASASGLSKAGEPLRRVMGYRTVRILDRSNYSFDDWHRMLQNELLAGRPVAYVGYNVTVHGHAFNIDGMNEEGLYHCNWGEGTGVNGYFSLEHLNVSQPHRDATEWGRLMGCHANEYMLILHPDSITDVLEPDTLTDYSKAVRVDDVHFRREIDNREYVMTDITMTNLTEDTLYHTFLVLQNALEDTALTEQGRPVAISSVRIMPEETITASVPCHFTATEGECIVTVTFGENEVAWSRKERVVKAMVENLSFKDLDTSASTDGTITLVLEATNNAQQGTSGRLLYFRLFKDGEDDTTSSDVRFLNLPAGESVRDTFSFHCLDAGGRYVLKIGDWSRPFHVVTFNVPQKGSAINDIHDGASKDRQPVVYDLQGRRVRRLHKGVHIVNGKIQIE